MTTSSRSRRDALLRGLDPLLSDSPAPHHDDGGAPRATDRLDEGDAHAWLLALARSHPRPVTATEAGEHLKAATPTSPSTSSAPPRLSPRRHWRWALTSAAAAAVAGGLVIIPPGQDEPAFASWTAVPAAMPAPDVKAAGQACKRDHQQGLEVLRESAPLLPTTERLERMRTVLAERRGKYAYTLLADDVWIVECLDGVASSMNPVGDVDDEMRERIIPAAGGVVVYTGGTARVPEGHYNWLTGRVGRHVTGVQVNSTGEGVVTATVSNGYFVAWWPGTRSVDATLTLHLDDGRTIEGLTVKPLSRFEGS